MVVSAKNGSIVAVTGSGIRHMSLSLIAFQPAIEEPSNIVPSAKMSSSIIETSKVTCCHLPGGGVNRGPWFLPCLSLVVFRTFLPVFGGSLLGFGVVLKMWGGWGGATSSGRRSSLMVSQRKKEPS